MITDENNLWFAKISLEFLLEATELATITNTISFSPSLSGVDDFCVFFFITRVLVRLWKWKTTENRLKLQFFKPCVNSRQTTYTISNMIVIKFTGKKLRRRILPRPANFIQLYYTITNLNNSSICSRYDNNANRRYPYPLFHVLTQLSVCICISKKNIFVFDYDVYAFYFFLLVGGVIN